MTIPKNRRRVTQKVEDEVAEDIRLDRKQRRERLDAAVGAVWAYVDEVSEGDDDMFAITTTLWSLLMTVGLRAVELICARRREVPSTNRRYDADGDGYYYYKQKTYTLRCVFGEGEMRGSQYVRGSNARTGEELSPEMVELGFWSLGGAFGPRLALECGRMCSVAAFEPAKEQLERFLGYVPSTRGLHGLVDRLGPMASGVLEEAPCPDGDVVVVQFDGRGVPKISEEEYEARCQPHEKGEDAPPERRRNDSGYLDNKREPGDKRTKKQEATVGIIYALDETDDGGWERVGDKQHVARLGDREAVARHLGRKLEELDDGEQSPERILVLTDGDENYETLIDEHFPDDIEHVIDYYHVCEYLWKAAAAVEDAHTLEMEALVRLYKDLLCEGRSEAVVTMLKSAHDDVPKHGPGTKERRERLEDAIRYITKRAELMPYDELLEENLEIGSGAIESAVRQIVALRFEGPGMRWGDDRPDHMLNLVCTRLSDVWDELVTTVRDHTTTPHRKDRITPVGVQEAECMDAAA